ncbi:MAG TPA: PIG-L family deacetylase, partial [Vicinamibacterales bacterium]|nr:PIG-L family deacetylase [Vicinamibacterales bacterium]
MPKFRCLVLAFAVLAAQAIAAQTPAPRVLRIVALGAHPDDAELKFAGTAALMAAQGHKVKLVALTNG